MPIALNHAWWKRSSIKPSSLPTCDTHWNAKSVQTFHNIKDTWTTSPAWTPICDNGGKAGGGVTGTGIGWTVTSTEPWAFCLQLVPGYIKRVVMRLSVATLSSGFKVYLARDGPVNGGGIGNGTPIKERLLFNVPERGEPGFDENWFYPSMDAVSDDAVLPLFGGHSYGYVWETINDVVPTGNLEVSIWTEIYYGGAGA